MSNNPKRRSVGFLNTDQHSLEQFEFSFAQTLESNASVSSEQSPFRPVDGTDIVKPSSPKSCREYRAPCCVCAVRDSSTDLPFFRETQSITDSVLNYRVENGRTYHAYKDGGKFYKIFFSLVSPAV